MVADDGHTAYISDMSSVIAFGKLDEHNTSVELVSLSSDGTSLPKVYVYSEYFISPPYYGYTKPPSFR